MARTLVPVSPLLDVLERVEIEDVEAAQLLLSISLGETLGEQISKAGPRLTAWLDQRDAAGEDALRVGLMRTYIAKRERGEDVSDLLAMAVDINKAAGELTDGSDEPRDERGRWTSRLFGGSKGALDTRDKTDQAFQAFAGGDKGAKDSGASGRDGWGNLRATGTALNALAGGQSPVGVAAQLIGQHGPEAEKILGPHVRRTAYRYRGTAKRPDEELQVAVAQAGTANTQVRGVVGAGGKAPDLRTEARGRYGAGTSAGIASAAQLPRGTARETPAGGVDQATLAARGDAAAAYLDRAIPNPALAAISEASGKVPPSQGVIINEKGQVTAQAVGYNGDHYLPFDLKNLSSLHGGQYVRTRAVGGPTTEDIYTGLVGGARQIQVVSNSGTFTVEFDPSLRGGKRFGDKAQQMVSRYGAMLDAIDSSKTNGLLSSDISPDKKRELRETALSDAGGNAQRAGERYKDLVEAERGKQAFMFDDEDALKDEAQHQARMEGAKAKLRGQTMTAGQIGRIESDKLAELTTQQSEQRARYYQLDGQGYATALAALQQEFPYFIRDVRHQDRVDFHQGLGQDVPAAARRRAAPDRSYTRTGQQRGTEGANRGRQGKVRAQTRSVGAAAGADAAKAPKDSEVTAEAAKTPATVGGKSFGDSFAQDSPALAPALEANKKTATRQAQAGIAALTALYVDDDQGRARGYRQNILAVNAEGKKVVDEDENSIQTQDIGTQLAWLTQPGNPHVTDGVGPFLASHPENVQSLLSNWRGLEAELRGATVGDQPADEIVAQTRAALQGLAPVTFKAGPPDAFYAPDTRNPQPQTFPEVTALGTNAENYDKAFAGMDAQQQKLTREFLKLTPDQMADEVREAVQSVQEGIESKQAGRNDGPELPEGMTDYDIDDHLDDPATSDVTPHLLAYQQAYSFATAYQQARTLPQRGGGTPFPAAPQGASDGRNDPTPWADPRRDAFGKSAHRLVVHVRR